MAEQRQEEISVCGVGRFRAIAVFASKQLEGTPFRFAAVMDTGSPEPYNFRPDRMRLVLRCLHPEPRCFIVGEGIPEEDNAAAVEVWTEFVAERKVESPLLINFREFENRTLEETLATPKEKLLAEVLETRMIPHFFGQGEQT